MELDRVQEVEDLIEGAVWEDEHVLGQSLDQAKKTALGIEPGVSAELLLEGFQTLDDT